MPDDTRNAPILHVHAELRRRGVTLALLWQEYRGLHPDGYRYSRFCDLHGEMASRTVSLIGRSGLFDFAQTSFRALMAGEVHDLSSR